MNPFAYRPEHLVKPDTKWADNWLSNALAWASQTPPLEPMCNEKDHWSEQVTHALSTDCPCCLLWRGLVLGGLVGVVLGCMLGGRRR